ncbi:hypothetical protein ACQEWB_17775 [Streptomyces sp. CA-249302]|uniref:hypothetical protein n=1 Tax=Streptomyces sp. CA-249302 TaxID=3240058 RepID=UPI003D94BE7D
MGEGQGERGQERAREGVDAGDWQGGARGDGGGGDAYGGGAAHGGGEAGGSGAAHGGGDWQLEVLRQLEEAQGRGVLAQGGVAEGPGPQVVEPAEPALRLVRSSEAAEQAGPVAEHALPLPPAVPPAQHHPVQTTASPPTPAMGYPLPPPAPAPTAPAPAPAHSTAMPSAPAPTPPLAPFPRTRLPPWPPPPRTRPRLPPPP